MLIGWKRRWRPGQLRRTGAVVGAALALSLMGSTPTSAAPAPPAGTTVPPTTIPRADLPLHTAGASIVDRTGQPVHLSAVNWYGGESVDFVPTGLEVQPLANIVRQIRQLGFNAVRLPWSNQMLEQNPVVPDYAVAANPQLQGLHAMAVYRIVVHALTDQGIAVILDNHNSNAEWCCGGNDGNMLWYNAQYPESSWLADWKTMVSTFRDDPLVIGADLRNEPRSPATWGGPASTNWQAAAERGGNAVLSVNRNLLVFVEGISYAGDLSGVQQLPVVLDVPHQLVYEVHDYGWYESGFTSYQQWYQQVYPKWAYLVTGPDPQPLWLGEFGTCNTAANCVASDSPGPNGFWFQILTTFVQRNHLSWAYWAVNGTQSTGAGRTYGAPETYGILNPQWDGSASAALTERLQQLESAGG